MHNFNYPSTPILYILFEKSPEKYFEELKSMITRGNIQNVYNHLSDYEKVENIYHGANALHCLCMIMSKRKKNTIKNTNYGINTTCSINLGLELLDFMIKYGVNIYHRDYYNQTPLEYVNDSFKVNANWEIDDDFVLRIRNIYNHFHINEYPVTYNTCFGDIRNKYSDRFYELYKLDNITNDTKEIIIDTLISKNISYNDDIYNIQKIINTINLKYKPSDDVVNPII